MIAELQAESIVVNRSERRIVDGVSLGVRGGELVAVEGPSGVGKTTLLLALAGLLPLERGEISIAGVSLAALSPLQRARQLAIAMQTPVLPPDLSVFDLVSLGLRPHEPDSHRETRRVFDSTTQIVSSSLLELNLGGFERRRLGELSGGEQRRVHLARVFAQRTPILLLDEPTAHLDEQSACRVLCALRKRALHGAAVLIVTHDVGVTRRYCNRTLCFRDGTLVSAGQRNQGNPKVQGL